jgi:hypothetical protein
MAAVVIGAHFAKRRVCVCGGDDIGSTTYSRSGEMRYGRCRSCGATVKDRAIGHELHDPTRPTVPSWMVPVPA